MLDIRPLDLSPEGIQRTQEFLAIVFPNAKHMTTEYLTRLFHGNPLGETGGYCVYDEGGELAAHFLMIPVKWRIFGEEEMGIWPFQLATHPEKRLKGIFSALVQKSHEFCLEFGYTYIFGIGNANSSPIYVKKFEYQAVGPLDVRVGLGVPPAPGEMPDCQLERVWDDPLGVKWRLGHASTPYEVKWKGDVGHVYADSNRFGIKVEIAQIHRSLLPEDMAELSSPQPFRMWIGKDASRAWGSSTYFELPKRIRPVPLTMLFRDFTDRKLHFDADKVRVDVFDFDAF